MKINWTKYEGSVEEMAVHLTTHARDRAVTVGLTKDRIQDIVNSAEDKIISLGKKFQTLIIKTRDAINIVGALSQEGGQYVFDVITVMVKKNFVPKSAFDKVIYVNEIEIPLNKLTPIQSYTDDQKVDDIAAKMTSGKKIPPIKVKKADDGTLKVIDGHHRLQAAHSVGKKKIDAKVYEQRIVHTSLLSIIDKIESERIGKISQLQEFKVGTRVRHRSRAGVVIAVSPKRTSVLVEFTDKTQKRFFVNKRAKNPTLDQLSMSKMLEVVEGGPGSGIKGHTTSRDPSLKSEPKNPIIGKPAVKKSINPQKIAIKIRNAVEQGYWEELQDDKSPEAIADVLDMLRDSSRHEEGGPRWIRNILPVNLLDDDEAYEKAKPELIKNIQQEL